MTNFLFKAVSCGITSALMLGIFSAVQAEDDNEYTSDGIDFSSKAILGVAVPNKTTLPELKEILKKRGCELSENEVNFNFADKTVLKGKRLDVGNGCFQLPSDPKVWFASTDKNSQAVVQIYLSFEEGHLPNDYGQYLQALEKAYGNPSGMGVVNKRPFVFWENSGHDSYVIMTGDEKTGPISITYYFGELGTRFLASLKKKHATSGVDLGKL